jgi:hypothetical protein
MTTWGFLARFMAFCSPGPVVKCTASSSHTATSGVTWGRPSARTVVTHDSWAVSNTARAFAQGVALAPGSLNRSSSSATGSPIVIPFVEGQVVNIPADRRACTSAALMP